jgi:hypothetical protein
MTIADRLKEKRKEFEEQYNALHYPSIQKNTLKKKVEILDELIVAYENYYNNSPPSLLLDEVQKILDQPHGFEEQKQQLLNKLETEEYQ